MRLWGFVVTAALANLYIVLAGRGTQDTWYYCVPWYLALSCLPTFLHNATLLRSMPFCALGIRHLLLPPTYPEPPRTAVAAAAVVVVVFVVVVVVFVFLSCLVLSCLVSSC